MLQKIDSAIKLGLDDDSLRRIQTLLLAAEQPDDIKQIFMAMRVQFLNDFSWIRSGLLTSGGTSAKQLGVGNFQRVWFNLPGVIAFDGAAGLELANAYVAAVDGLNGKSLRRALDVDARMKLLGKQCYFSKLFLWNWGKLVEQRIGNLTRNRLLQAAVACERYRLATAQWPEDLNALVGEYLKAIPLDPFDGRPIRYKRIPEGIMLWSVGQDMIDNGGNLPEAEGRKASSSDDKTQVIRNPDLRGKLTEEPESKKTR